jgi:hypothetical protein
LVAVPFVAMWALCCLQGNALGKGPVLFCFGAKGMRRVAAAAAGGDPAFQQLELDMYRLAGEAHHMQW